MGPFLIVAVIFVISSILQRATQKKTTSQPQTQRRQHPAFEETAEKKTEQKPVFKTYESTIKPTVREAEHTVKPFTETEHRHMETSLTGISDCTSELSPLVTVNETITAASERKAGLKVNLTSQNLAQAILCSEILGKPKALRR